MKTEVKKIDSATRQINIEVTGDVVKNKFEDVFKRIAKEAKVSGFRVGHAPRDILEKQYSSHAHEQVLKELIPDVYNEALKKEDVDALGMPDITEVKLDRVSLQFTATVEVSPEIKLKDYKKIKINYKKSALEDGELKRQLDALKESRKADSYDDNLARSLGYPNVAELENAFTRQILVQKDSAQVKKIEESLIENLLKDLDFKLPQSLVARQLQALVRQAKLDLTLKGMPQDQIGEQEKLLIKELEPQARKQVKVYLVMAEVAKKENITIDDHMPSRVIEFLLREAEWKIE